MATFYRQFPGQGGAHCCICLVSEAVIAKNVIDTELDFISRFAPFWAFIAYLVTGLCDRVSEISFMAAIVVTTVSVLILYAL
jgi:hypothetical protein